ncbi:hypothetical protein ACQKWADRAFT_307022 [Trichoderma austrokoningii]
MDNADEEQISEQVLDDLHHTVVSNISRYMWRPKTQWERRPSNNDNVSYYQCKDSTVIKLTFPIAPEYYKIIILRIESKSNRAKINLFQTRDLVPLSSYPDCGISDGERSYSLKFGKKVHLSQRQLSLHIDSDCTLHLLWLFRTKEDFIGKQS